MRHFKIALRSPSLLTSVWQTLLFLALTSCGALKDKILGHHNKGQDKSDHGAPPSGEPDGPLTRTPDTASSLTRADQLRMFLKDLKTKVELRDGALLSADAISGLNFDPISVARCDGALQDAPYKAFAGDLGGFKWGYGVTNYRNDRLPFLYNGRPGDEEFSQSMVPASDSATGGSAKESGAAAPTIKRADLIGRFGNYVVFLSKRFGLFFVKMPEGGGAAPELSCSVLVPGEPLNFYVDQGMLVLLVNPSDGKNDAAVLRFAFDGMALKHVDHQLLKAQRIVDSRMFNQTLAVYGQHSEAAIPLPNSPVAQGGMAGDVASMPSGGGAGNQGRAVNFFVLNVMQLTKSAIDVKFQENFAEEDGFYRDIYGANGEPDQSAVGKIANASTYFNNFLSASDSYLAISKLTRQSIVTGIGTSTTTYETCLDWNPHYQKVSYEACTPRWKEEANPAFDPNFSCPDAAKFDKCVADNATKFVRSRWTFLGNSCETVTYWNGQCMKFGHETFVSHYPIVEDKSFTELIVYHFEGDTFTRMSSPAPLDLAKPFPADGKHLVVEGWLKEYKSINFRDGHLYAVASHGTANPWWGSNATEQLTTSLTTFAISGEAFVKSSTLTDLAPGETLEAVLFNQATLFLVTFRQTDPLIAIDLTNPAVPRVAGSVSAPGYSSQLFAIDGARQVAGIGTEQEMTPAGYNTQRAKVSLFNTKDLAHMVELGSLILGKDADYSNSAASGDDQMYTYDPEFSRLFVPYSGGTRVDSEHDALVCWANRYDYQNRIAIASISATGVSAEAELALPQQVLRTQSYDEQNALAFADAGVYHLEKGSDKNWGFKELRDFYVTEGLYTDASLPDGIAVAIQVKRNGWTANKIRLAMGTMDQLMRDDGVKTIDLPDNITACLGDPQAIRFLDNNIVFSFLTTSFKDNQSIEYHARFAYSFDDKGFTQLSDDQGKALESEPQPICYFDAPLATDADFGAVEAAVAILAPEQLTCELVNRRPYVQPLFCDYRFGYSSHGYCANGYHL